MKYYIKSEYCTAGGTRIEYEVFDEKLNKMNALCLNPRLVNELGLVEVLREDSSILCFYDNNIYIGEIQGCKYYAKGERIEGAAVDASKKMKGSV